MLAEDADTIDLSTCLRLAHARFVHSFHHRCERCRYIFSWLLVRVLDLVLALPWDVETADGARFWAGGNRMPYVTEFDAENPLHFKYITSALQLFAATFGLSLVSPRCIDLS